MSDADTIMLIFLGGEVDVVFNILLGVLDIGSCYNPLSRGQFASYLDVIAIDLHPADPSVYRANFFDIAIGQVRFLVRRTVLCRIVFLPVFVCL